MSWFFFFFLGEAREQGKIMKIRLDKCSKVGKKGLCMCARGSIQSEVFMKVSIIS